MRAEIGNVDAPKRERGERRVELGVRYASHERDGGARRAAEPRRKVVSVRSDRGRRGHASESASARESNGGRDEGRTEHRSDA